MVEKCFPCDWHQLLLLTLLIRSKLVSQKVRSMDANANKQRTRNILGKNFWDLILVNCWMFCHPSEALSSETLMPIAINSKATFYFHFPDLCVFGADRIWIKWLLFVSQTFKLECKESSQCDKQCVTVRNNHNWLHAFSLFQDIQRWTLVSYFLMFIKQ